MDNRSKYEAIVVGAGPNGLGAAITMAREGYSVLLIEAKETVGGGCRSLEMTLPGFIHDPCATIHSLGVTSPFFNSLPLSDYGLEWVYPSAALAHPLDNGEAVILERSVDATALQLGRDSDAYRRLMGPFVDNWRKLSQEILGPFRIPRSPLIMARFGWYGLRSAKGLANQLFKEKKAPALFAGLAAHSIQSLEKIPTSAFGLVLGTSGHAAGWPVARGGSQKIIDALAKYFVSLGGKIITGQEVKDIDELPSSKFVFFDLSPRQLLKIAGKKFPESYRKQLKKYRYGPGVYKIDYALDGPIPWNAADCARAATVHIGGTLEEIVEAEEQVWQGEHPSKPFVLLAQQTTIDPSRAPAGKHTAWAYCHVPNGSTFEMKERIESQIERFAPGFCDRILATTITTPNELEEYNANYIGGDINSGVQDLGQLFTRPVARLVPYSTPAKGIYICSSSTPPGGGVHGMSGYHAAKAALKTMKSR
jgi:phytoene dehydrogenase-like protein